MKLTAEKINDEIKTIISKVAGIAKSELENDLSLRDELVIDSLKQIEIIAKTEMHLGISIDENELMALETLGDFLDLVVKAISQKGEG